MPSTAVLEMKKQQVAALSDRIKNSCAGVVVDEDINKRQICIKGYDRFSRTR